MSGRLEKEIMFENKTKKKLENAPKVLTEYYYSLISASKSYKTAYDYICYIISFLDFTFKEKCNDNFYLKVKPIHINRYISSLRTKNINGKIERTSDSLKTVHWSALNSFFQFLVPDYIDYNPVANTERPKMKDNPNVTYLTEEEITKIINNAKLTARSKLKNRDLCILTLGFATGLRSSAITQIDTEDIDFTHNQIRVTEKGDRDEYVMFGDNLKKQLQYWLKDRNQYFGECDSNALFVSQMGKRLSGAELSKIVKKYSNGVIDKKITPHVMRHSCATNLYEKTGDIYLCAKQLNHKNISTTQRYAEISKKKQKEAANTLDNMFTDI